MESKDYEQHLTESEDFNKQAKKINSFNQMKCPKLIGSVNNVTIYNAIDTVTSNIQTYGISYPFSGVNPDYQNYGLDQNGFYAGQDYSMGSNFFQQIGTCDNKSDDPCKNKPRHVYVRNIPTGKIPLFGNVSFQGFTGCNLAGLTENRGIFSGILEDISDIQPTDIIKGIGNEGNIGSKKCTLQTYPVGAHIYDTRMEGKTWKDLTRCTSSYFNQVESTTGRPQKFPTGTPIIETFTHTRRSKILFLLLFIILLIIIRLCLFYL
jgi:hypothetical protein